MFLEAVNSLADEYTWVLKVDSITFINVNNLNRYIVNVF